MTDDPSSPRADPEDPLFASGGEMGRVMASWDWAATPVGPPQHWPTALRGVVQILLTSRFSMWMAWGPELAFFYNDAYQRDTLQAKHPWALGRPAREVWAEIWDDIGPRIRSVLDTGEATWDEALLLFLERAGYVEETYHTFSYSPLRDGDGRVAGMLCVVSEDTDRVLGERRLRVLSELGEVSAVSAPTVADACAAALATLERGRADIPFASLYLLDEDADDAGETETLPEAATARRMGYYGVVDDPAVLPERFDRAERPAEPLWTLLETGQPQVIDGLSRDHPGAFLPADRPDGGRTPDEVVAVPLPGRGGGRPVGVLFAGVSPLRALDEEYRRFIDLVAAGVGTAVADAHTLQAQQRRAEELTELDRAKTEFFTGASHELRTPLTLIAGPAEDALADTADPLSAGQRVRMELIARSSGRLRRLVDTMLEVSRLEAGQLVPSVTAVDLAELTRGIAESFAPAVTRAGLGFGLDCPPLPVAVAVDVDMWEKIVLNLLSNAVKYTLTGHVRLALRPSTSGGVELEVSDTGIGIPDAELPQLFQRFHRVRGATGRSHEGSGIGLALVAELTALHHGRATVESIPGHGSTFTIALPPAALTDAPPAAPMAGVSTAADLYREEALQWSGPAGELGPVAGSGGVAHAEPAPDRVSATGYPWTGTPVAGRTDRARVLVVEDNRDLRRFLVGLLVPHYSVLEAEDGVAAWERVRAQRPDLVLTDVMMPGLDGFELLAAVRAEPATAATPVVLLSARAGDEAVAEGLAAGADDYLVKPFSSVDLLARIRANLEMARLRAHEGAWRAALLDALQDALVVADGAGRIVEVNQAFTDILGYGADGLPYSPPYPWWPDPTEDPEDFARVTDAFAAVQASGGRFLLPQRHRDGRRLLVEVSASTFADTDGDDRVLVGLIRDVTIEHRAARHAQLLSDTGSLLAEPIALAERLARFARLAAPVMTDLVVVSLTGPDGRLAPVAAAHRTRPDLAESARELPPHEVPAASADRYLGGRPFVVDPPPGERSGGSPAEEPGGQWRRELGLHCSVVAPLVVAGKLLGSVSFGSTDASRDRLGDVDLAVAEELARRVAGAVETDRVAGLERHLLTVTSALAAAATVAQAAAALAENIGEVLGAEGVAVHVPGSEDHTRLHLAHVAGYPPGLAAAFSIVGRGADVPAADVARTGTPAWWHDQQAWRDRFPTLADRLVAAGAGADDLGQAVAALPLLVEQRVVGVLTMGFPTARTFPDDERSFVSTLVAQASQAIDRTSTADTRREIADTLQHGLLPAGLPAVKGLALAARYLPAGEHTAAGGDWYDVTVLDEQHVAITVGDVVGHGAPAAAVMGQLRAALAAYLLQSHSPAQALHGLSRFARTVPGARGSTAICLVLHTGNGELRWARAGHPPPLVVEPGAPTRLLEDAHGAMLGLPDVPLTEATARLEPGATVLLYTDGLVERRGEDIDDGLARLSAACTTATGVPSRFLTTILDHAIGTDQPTDDVAAIALRRLPAPLRDRLPADPGRLAVMRRSIERWTAIAGLDEDQAYDVQLTVGEAVANAIEHAYRDRTPGPVDYELDVGPGGEVRALIVDRGRWRPPPADPGHRGRGLLLIHKLGTDVQITHGTPDIHPDGTEVRFSVPPVIPVVTDHGSSAHAPPDPGTVRTRAAGTPADLSTRRAPAGALQLRITGDLDLSTVESVRASLLEHLRDPADLIVLATDGITYLSSAGVGLLLTAVDHARGRLRLHIEPGTPAARILALTGLDRYDAAPPTA